MQSFQLIKPCLALAPYIRHYWILQDDSVTPVSERTLPIGCMQPGISRIDSNDLKISIEKGEEWMHDFPLFLGFTMTLPMHSFR